jgi:methylmalonyl-CoA mutase N-terminal domain/subunit
MGERPASPQIAGTATLVGAPGDLAEHRDRWEQRPEVAESEDAFTDTGLPVKVAYTPLDAPQGDYLDRLGMPGEYPYTRGIYPTMYRGRLWTMRLYSGWGTPEDTNERFRYLLDRGQTGLSVALDLPTQMGMDSDHALAQPEIGKVGVAVDSIDDMERIFAAIPLDRISTSFTINATAPILLAMYQVVGERQGVDPRELRGTVQNDILKEYLARKTYVHPPEPSLRLVADVIEYSSRVMPKFNPISVCGYHMRQAGCDAVQEVALTVANASAYVEALVARGLPVDSFAPRFSFNLSVMRDLFEEVAKLRAARRIWAHTMRERFGAEDPRSWTLRLFSGGDGTSLTAVEPHNNIMRITLQALAIVLGGAQAVHTISWDEAIGIPTEASSLLALRTQQILAYESGVARTADPLGGSYYVESLTDELERRITALIDAIEERGGVVAGIEDGSLEQAIADSAYEQQRGIETGDHVVIGVNRFAREDQAAEPVETFVVGRDVIDRQLARIERVRAERDGEATAAALSRLEQVAATDENVMPAIVDAVRSRATVGEITQAMGRVFGYHQRSTVT